MGKTCLTPGCGKEPDVGLEHCHRHMHAPPALDGLTDDPNDVVSIMRSMKPEEAPERPVCKRPGCKEIVNRRAKFTTGRYWALYCSAICNNIHSKARRKKLLTERKHSEPPKMSVCQWKHSGGCNNEFKKEGNRRYCDEHKIAAFEEGALERQNRYLTKKVAVEEGKPPQVPIQEPLLPAPLPQEPDAPLTRIPRRVIEALEADIARMEFMETNVEAVTVSFTVDRRGRVVLGSPDYRRTK